MRAQGATVIDPADIPSIVTTDPSQSLLRWPVCSGPGDAKGRDEDCSVVFKYGMKRDFNAWLASLGDRAPVKSLEELRAWNRTHEPAGTLKYGQAQLDISDEMDLKAIAHAIEADRAKDVALARRDGIDAVMQSQQARRAAVPRRQRRGDCRQARLPDRDRSVRHWCRTPGCRRIRRQAVALRRQLHRQRVQRGAAHRAGLRVRAGDEATSPASARLTIT